MSDHLFNLTSGLGGVGRGHVNDVHVGISEDVHAEGGGAVCRKWSFEKSCLKRAWQELNFHKLSLYQVFDMFETKFMLF